MKEELLHFVWKFQLFKAKLLQTVNGKIIEIVSVGQPNNNSGPDFLNAKVLIDGQLWAGNVEIHLKASDWYVHNHQKDTAYDAVILHVVWEDDVSVFNINNTPLPTLCLQDKILKSTLKNYFNLFKKDKKWINCENFIDEVDTFTWGNWKDRLLIERLEDKTNFISTLLKQTHNDWETTLFLVLAKNFGLKINADTFLAMAKTIPFSVVKKTATKQNELEALFFGQANLLLETKESVYYHTLKEEYGYLKHKFKLMPQVGGNMKFFRLRPNNFPTIRLSQLATLYHTHQNLFSKVIEINNLPNFYDLFSVQTSSYWKTHYTFDKTSKKSTKKLSNSFIDLLLINTIIPLKFLYRKSEGKSVNKVISILSEIKSEKNNIINHFEDLQIKSKSASDSQALLQLKNQYCNFYKCLNCVVGNYIIKKEA